MTALLVIPPIDEVFKRPAKRPAPYAVVQTNGRQFPYELRVSRYDSCNQFVVHKFTAALFRRGRPGGSRSYVTLR